MSYSQNGQDMAVVELFGGEKGLHFIELGAGNGRELSNTLLLEEQYSWAGMLVEASPLSFSALQTNRPNTINVNTLLWDEAGQMLKFWLRDGWMSRIVDQPDVKNPMESRKVHRDRQRAAVDGRLIELETDTLYNVIQQHYR